MINCDYDISDNSNDAWHNNPLRQRTFQKGIVRTMALHLQFLSIMRYRTEYVDESAVLVRSDLLVCSAMSCAMLFIMYALYTRVRLLYWHVVIYGVCERQLVRAKG